MLYQQSVSHPKLNQRITITQRVDSVDGMGSVDPTGRVTLGETWCYSEYSPLVAGKEMLDTNINQELAETYAEFTMHHRSDVDIRCYIVDDNGQTYDVVSTQPLDIGPRRYLVVRGRKVNE